MQLEELITLVGDLESDRVERTVASRDTDKLAIAVCAFANDMPNHRLPGYLFVGAEPDGTASGQAVSDQLLQTLAGIRADGNIQPLPAMNVQKHSLGGGEMAVVEVFPSDLPPVRYKGQVWIRVGPRRAVASEAEERILTERRTALVRTWDARPCRDATVSDLAIDLFVLNYRPRAVSPDVIAENERGLDQQLAALRLLDPRSGCPTNAAVLLLGLDPLAFFPGAFVQYVQYDGFDEAATPVRDRRMTGDLLTVLRGLDQLALDVSGGRPVPTGLADREVFDFPPQGLHELFMNAVIHRNYDGSTTPIMINHFHDRLDVHSPGGLHGDLTRDAFPGGTSYRNPVLAEAARVLGFVNRYGRGIPRAQELLRLNNSPQAEFEIQPNHFRVTIRRRP